MAPQEKDIIVIDDADVVKCPNNPNVKNRSHLVMCGYCGIPQRKESLKFHSQAKHKKGPFFLMRGKQPLEPRIKNWREIANSFFWIEPEKIENVKILGKRQKKEKQEDEEVNQVVQNSIIDHLKHLHHQREEVEEVSPKQEFIQLGYQISSDQIVDTSKLDIQSPKIHQTKLTSIYSDQSQQIKELLTKEYQDCKEKRGPKRKHKSAMKQIQRHEERLRRKKKLLKVLFDSQDKLNQEIKELKRDLKESEEDYQQLQQERDRLKKCNDVYRKQIKDHDVGGEGFIHKSQVEEDLKQQKFVIAQNLLYQNDINRKDAIIRNKDRRIENYCKGQKEDQDKYDQLQQEKLAQFNKFRIQAGTQQKYINKLERQKAQESIPSKRLLTDQIDSSTQKQEITNLKELLRVSDQKVLAQKDLNKSIKEKWNQRGEEKNDMRKNFKEREQTHKKIHDELKALKQIEAQAKKQNEKDLKKPKQKDAETQCIQELLWKQEVINGKVLAQHTIKEYYQKISAQTTVGASPIKNEIKQI